jgi:hypothetical protein
MPTIAQLPLLSAVDPEDEIPLSHGGTTQSISVGTLLSGMQPAILTPTGTLLGRESLGPGGPEPITVGIGLDLQSSILAATGTDHANFADQTALELTDQLVLNSDGSPKLLGLSLLRGLFSAGSNIAIDSAGTISMASASADGTPISIANLPITTTISSGDLVGINQGGSDDSITYQNFLNGLTIDQAQAAAAVTDSDTIWVSQGGSTMVCQTFSAVLAWITINQPSYRFPVVELTTNTTLDGTVHNGRILVCSEPMTLTPVFANMGSGFACSVVNLSGANLIFGAGIVSSSGVSILPNGLSCTLQGVTYSGGSVIYASISGTASQNSQIITPSAVTNLVVTSASSNGMSLAWISPISGGAVTTFTVQYRVTGTTTWIIASSSIIGMSCSFLGLQPSVSYDCIVFATNSAGAGPSSSLVTGTTTTAGGVIPGQVTGLGISTPTGTGLTLAWSAPSVGSAPISYAVNYRPTGTTSWVTFVSGVSGVSTTVTGLSSGTSYDFEVVASNASGSGTPTIVTSQSTATIGTSVTEVQWNVGPSGPYTQGSGSIGINAQITPATASVQFGFSTSAVVLPTAWTPATNVNTNLWGAYVNIPATPGTWYAWVEGIDGSLSTVYPTPFTVV